MTLFTDRVCETDGVADSGTAIGHRLITISYALDFTSHSFKLTK